MSTSSRDPKPYAEPKARFAAASLVELVWASEEDPRPLRGSGVDYQCELFVQGGQVLHASFADLAGADAVYAMMRAERERGGLRLVVDAERLPLQRTIMLEWSQLRAESRREAPLQDLEGAVTASPVTFRTQPSSAASGRRPGRRDEDERDRPHHPRRRGRRVHRAHHHAMTGRGRDAPRLPPADARA